MRSVAQMSALTTKVRRRVNRLDRWANFCVDNPGSGHFHRVPTLNWFQIGFPVYSCCEVRSCDRLETVALHAPSHLASKGSTHIESTAALVEQEISLFQLVKITNRPHADVIEALHDCDFVVDQLYSDTPCAGLAVEAASMGRPAIVGGYGWSEEWLKVSKLGEYPSAVCHPRDLEGVMRQMATDPAFRARKSAAAIRRAGLWNYRAVAERVVVLFGGEIPDDWYFSAEDVPAFYSGGGLDDRVVAKATHQLVCEYGWQALQLKHCPVLLGKAQEFLRSHGYSDFPELPSSAS